MSRTERAIERARSCFLRACELDVAVRKPGNVSRASAGHGMHAELFLASAQAAAGPLFELGARVGERIEGAVTATLAVAGCNTNLGILLLCAPLARAIELQPEADGLRAAVTQVLAELDLADASAAFRAIALAQPGGLGRAEAQDVREAPSLPLREAMALAAERDSIARQYRDGYAELFALGPPALRKPAFDDAARVQAVYLAFLSQMPDSHIVRKHGEPVAHSVMAAAQAWQRRLDMGVVLDQDPAFEAWDLALKQRGINPGTSADLTVATLFAAGLTSESGGRWHES